MYIQFCFCNSQFLVNVTSCLFDEELEDDWVNVEDSAREVNVTLTSIEVVTVALIGVANNSDTGILTIETEHFGQFYDVRILLYYNCI